MAKVTPTPGDADASGESSSPVVTQTVEATKATPAQGHRAAAGVVWTIAQSLASRASLLLGQLALARILMPQDFGVVGLAMTISNISTALVYFGIDQILQQRKHTAYLWATQIFWISLGCGFFGAFVMIGFGAVGVYMFHSPELLKLILLIAVSTPLTVLSTVPQAALQWQLRFGFLSAYLAFEALFNQVFIVILALLGFGPLSFGFAFVVIASMRAAVFWRAAKVKLRPIKKSRGWGLIARRGMAALGNRISLVIVGQGDFVILGLLAPTNVVGAYFFAFRLASQPISILGTSITNVLFSSLLKIQGEDQRARVAFSTAEFVGSVTIPFCFLVAALAKPALPILFGARWDGAIPLVQILSVGLPFDAIAWSAGALLGAEGLFRRQFLYQAISVPFFLTFAATGAVLGSATGLAIGVGTYFFLHPLAYTSVTFGRTSIGWRPAIALFFRLFIASTASFGGVVWVTEHYLAKGHPILEIFLVGVLAPCAYLGMLLLVAPALFKKLLERGLGALNALTTRMGLPHIGPPLAIPEGADIEIGIPEL